MQHLDFLRTYPGQIVGFRADGRPIRTIAGGAPDGDEGGGDAGPGDQSSGDAGQQGGEQKPDGQQGDADAGKWDGKIESLPTDAQKAFKKLQDEAANASSKSRENARKEAEQDLLKKLGLVKGDDKPDPDQLAKDLAAARAGQRYTAIELAIYRKAGKHEGDPDALLDSRAFLAKVADLDPTAKDFATKVETAIKDAVKDNPKLKTGRAPGASSVDHGTAPGEGRSTKPQSLADAVSGHYGTGS